MDTARPPTLPKLTAQFVFDLELLLLTAALVVLVIAGVMAVIRVKRWWSAKVEEPASRIEHYRALMDQGILAPEEFARIQENLEKKTPDDPPSGNQPTESPSPP